MAVMEEGRINSNETHDLRLLVQADARGAEMIYLGVER